MRSVVVIQNASEAPGRPIVIRTRYPKPLESIQPILPPLDRDQWQPQAFTPRKGVIQLVTLRPNQLMSLSLIEYMAKSEGRGRKTAGMNFADFQRIPRMFLSRLFSQAQYLVLPGALSKDAKQIAVIYRHGGAIKVKGANILTEWGSSSLILWSEKK